MSLARKYRIVPTSSPWVSEDGKCLEVRSKRLKKSKATETNQTQLKRGKHYEKYLHYDLKKRRSSACTQTERKHNLIFVLPNEGRKSGSLFVQKTQLTSQYNTFSQTYCLYCFPRSFVLLFPIVLRQLCLLHEVKAKNLVGVEISVSMK